MPGEIAFTRIGATSRDTTRASASMAASTAASVEVPTMGLRLIHPENNTIEPFGLRIGAVFDAVVLAPELALKENAGLRGLKFHERSTYAAGGGGNDVIERASTGERRCDSRLIGDVQHQGIRNAHADFVARGIQAVLIGRQGARARRRLQRDGRRRGRFPDAPPVITTRLPGASRERGARSHPSILNLRCRDHRTASAHFATSMAVNSPASARARRRDPGRCRNPRNANVYSGTPKCSFNAA